MKKTLLSILFLAIAMGGFSQSQIGVKFGYLIPNYKITSTPPSSTESISVNNGLNYCLNYKRRWPGLFNFGAEMEYHQITSHFTMEYNSLGADVYRDMDLTTNYLNFRLLPEFVYGKKLRFYLQVGPYMGFLLSSNAKGQRIVTDGTNKVKADVDGSASDIFPGIDWGFFVGAGVEYPLSKRIKLAIDAQYSRGLAGFSQEDEYVFATQNFTVGLSFIYVLKGYAERMKDED